MYLADSWLESVLLKGWLNTVIPVKGKGTFVNTKVVGSFVFMSHFTIIMMMIKSYQIELGVISYHV